MDEDVHSCLYDTAFQQFPMRKAGANMSRREETEKRAEALLTPIVESAGFELVDVEFVKEAGTWYLRGFIENPAASL